MPVLRSKTPRQQPLDPERAGRGQASGSPARNPTHGHRGGTAAAPGNAAAKGMPLFGDPAPGHAPGHTPGHASGRSSGFLTSCANPDCASGWLHLWRSRSAPIFEDGWSCSLACTQARVELAVRRELEGRRSESPAHRHRIPLGLVMLEQGWITADQLRRAIEAQKAAGGQGRLGSWLVRQQGVSEQLVTRALGLQWSCPVLPLDFHDAPALAPALPRLFVDAFGALPLRVAAGRVLYLGFEDRLDPVMAFGLERMLGLRVETGVVRGSEFRAAHTRMLNAAFPRTELLEVSSEAQLGRALSRVIEKVKPVQSRLVRLHDCLWLRLWLGAQTGPLPEAHGVEDVICSLDAN